MQVTYYLYICIKLKLIAMKTMECISVLEAFQSELINTIRFFENQTVSFQERKIGTKQGIKLLKQKVFKFENELEKLNKKEQLAFVEEYHLLPAINDLRNDLSNVNFIESQLHNLVSQLWEVDSTISHWTLSLKKAVEEEQVIIG